MALDGHGPGDAVLESLPDAGLRARREPAPPLGQVTTPAGSLVNELGGAWSSYWYNNFSYESEITKGLNVFRVSDIRLAGALRLDRLNPQTEEFSLP